MDKKQNSVFPGRLPIDFETGLPICPSPVEIDIIKVKKVFQECAHTQVEDVEIEFYCEGNSHQSNLKAECVSVVVLEENCQLLGNGLVRVTATLEVTSRLNGMEESEEFTIDKTFRLSRAGEPGLIPQCHIFPECLFCFVSDIEDDEEEECIIVTCCVGILILVKLETEVQLMVPTFGYPVQPPECAVVAGECPSDFTPQWPPYPPQNR